MFYIVCKIYISKFYKIYIKNLIIDNIKIWHLKLNINVVLYLKAIIKFLQKLNKIVNKYLSRVLHNWQNLYF